MAIALDNISAATGTSGANDIQWNHTVTAALSNSILVICFTHGNNPARTVTSVIWDNGGTNAACTKLGSVTDSSGFCLAEIWYLKNPVSGTKQISVNLSGTATVTGGAASFSGVDQTTPWNASSPQSNTGTEPTQPTVNITSASGEVVIDCLVDNENNTDTLAPGAGQTAIYNTTVGGNLAGGSSRENGAGSVTMSWSGVTGGATWGIVGGSLKPDGGGGGGPTIIPGQIEGPIPTFNRSLFLVS